MFNSATIKCATGRTKSCARKKKILYSTYIRCPRTGPLKPPNTIEGCVMHGVFEGTLNGSP